MGGTPVAFLLLRWRVVVWCPCLGVRSMCTFLERHARGLGG